MKFNVLLLLCSLGFCTSMVRAQIVRPQNEVYLPTCILLMKQNGSTAICKTYNYKGQLWFVTEKKAIRKMANVSDRQEMTKFYDNHCNLVCTWVKGGIAGLNKVIPDSIQKDKIRLLKEEECIPKTIVVFALERNAMSIDTYDYNGQTLYRVIDLREPLNRLAQKGIRTVSEYYYDKDRKPVLEFKRATDAIFYRAQQWLPAGTQPAKLKKMGTVWKMLI